MTATKCFLQKHLRLHGNGLLTKTFFLSFLIIRVLSAILLMGNVEFAPRLGDESFDVEVFGKEELSKVAKLLGISSTMLWQGITTRRHTIKGHPVKSMSDANTV